jgi:hypothetical protein
MKTRTAGDTLNADRTPSAGPESADPEVAPVSERRRAALLSATFFFVVAVGLWHHEMWRDEWQSWMLARDTPSIGAFLAQLRYEGHFPTWYSLLFALSRVTRDPAAMQLAHLVIATGSIYLLGRFAPLPWTQKVLAAFGYFLAFEYAVIARHYVLTVLALFAFCALFAVRRRHPFALGFALLLLASTSIYGTVLAAAAGGMSLLAAATDNQAAITLHRSWARAGLMVWVVAVAAGIALIQIWTPEGLPHAVGSAPENALSLWAVASTGARITVSYLPIPDLTVSSPWSTNALPDHSRPWLLLQFAIAALIIVAAILLFLRTPLVLAFFLIGTSAILLFHHLVFTGFLRHHGHLFLLFLACLWLAGYGEREWKPPPPLERWAGLNTRLGRTFVAAILLVQVVGAAILYAYDIRRPFSASAPAAEFIRAEGLEGLPIAGSPAPAASSIAGILDRPIYYVAVGAQATFVPWDRHARGRDRAFEMRYLRRFLDDPTSDVLVILGRPFEGWDSDLEAEELARFPSGLAAHESYVLYRVGRGER